MKSCECFGSMLEISMENKKNKKLITGTNIMINDVKVVKHAHGLCQSLFLYFVQQMTQ